MRTLDAIVDQVLNSTTEPQHALVAGITTSKKTQYSVAKGVVALPDGPAVTKDSQFNLFSCTKSMVSMATLILVEQGKLDLHAPAKKYFPLFSELYIVTENDIDNETGNIIGTPVKPTGDITIEHLLLHTAGFAYPFTDKVYFKIMSTKRVFSGNPMDNLFTPSTMPLVHEPGAKWTYGYSTDWLGLVVEAASGKKLSDFLKLNIFDKASMKDSTFTIDDPSRVIKIHTINEDGNLRPEKKPSVPYKPKVDMGGQGCFTTVDDFLKFLRIWLNYGVSPDTGKRLLQKSTVENAIQNHLSPGMGIDFLMGIQPELNDPKPDLFSYIGCAISLNDLMTGRPAGTLYWGGISNFFYWLDFKNDCAGFFGCQTLPFLSKVSLKNFGQFEQETYKILHGSGFKL